MLDLRPERRPTCAEILSRFKICKHSEEYLKKNRAHMKTLNNMINNVDHNSIIRDYLMNLKMYSLKEELLKILKSVPGNFFKMACKPIEMTGERIGQVYNEQ